jgi:probable HAF family extracellular repeat protein
MKSTSTALGIAAATLLIAQLDVRHSPTLIELPRLSTADVACGATAINNQGQMVGVGRTKNGEWRGFVYTP